MDDAHNESSNERILTPLHSGHGNAVLNFMRDPLGEFPQYAEAFRSAGYLLLQKLNESSIYTDHEVLPIFYNYRHALELALKGIIVEGSRYMVHNGEEKLIKDKEFYRHELANFLPAISTIYQFVNWGWDIDIAGIKSWEEFERIVIAVENFDKSSFTTRYPVDKKGKGTVDHHTVVNPFLFADKVDPVVKLLCGSADQLKDMLYLQLEHESCERQMNGDFDDFYL